MREGGPGRSLILASRSPRRRQLLEMLAVPHLVSPVAVDEAPRPEEAPETYVRRLARDKALAGAARDSGVWVLGADTTVVVDGVLLGKPGSSEEAKQMLGRLSGVRHDVITAVALARDARVLERHDRTAVWFRPLSPERIRAYVATGEPMDKAGAYGAQGLGAALIDRIEGDFFSVMGLPVRLVVDLLDEAGIAHTLTR